MVIIINWCVKNIIAAAVVFYGHIYIYIYKKIIFSKLCSLKNKCWKTFYSILIYFYFRLYNFYQKITITFFPKSCSLFQINLVISGIYHTNCDWLSSCWSWSSPTLVAFLFVARVSFKLDKIFTGLQNLYVRLGFWLILKQTLYLTYTYALVLSRVQVFLEGMFYWEWLIVVLLRMRSLDEAVGENLLPG